MDNADKKVYMKAYHEKNKDKLKAKAKEYLQKPEVRENYLVNSKEYYKKNKDKINAKSKVYRQKNREKLNIYAKEYRERNRERLLTRMRVYGKEHYKKNKELLDLKHREYYSNNREKRIAHNKERYGKMKEDFFLSYKKNKYCSVCGYNEHPEILQFHHKDRKEKDFTIGNLPLHDKNSIKVLEAEVEKCVLLCPNCHMLLHFKRVRGEKTQ